CDFDVLPEQQQEAHQPFQREAGETPTNEGGDFRLVHSQQFGGLNLGQAFVTDEHGDLVGKLNLGKRLLGVRQAQIGKLVSTANGVITFTFWHRYFSSSRSISMAPSSRCF